MHLSLPTLVFGRSGTDEGVDFVNCWEGDDGLSGGAGRNRLIGGNGDRHVPTHHVGFHNIHYAN